MTVKIPLDKEKYSLFVYGKLKAKYFFEDEGTLLILENNSFGVAFYDFSRYRRAYVFCDANVQTKDISVYEGNLPLVKDKVKIIYTAEGRKIDLLKFMCSNIEQYLSDDVCLYSINYWIKLISLIDSYGTRKGMTGKTKRNLILLTEKYVKERKRLHEAL